jgi:8-oxo-dGTP pyrophosphatase MutT (NUDIX family)
VEVRSGLAAALNDGPPVVPRDSASVLLVDGSTRPWQVLMMRRPRAADFAPGVYVFPGGSVHDEDRALEAGDGCRAAAVRELFEEVGILLARRRGRPVRDRECDELRRLLGDGCPWPRALRELELTPAGDRLAFLCRWITPEAVIRRYDTRFYLARRPAGQTVRPHPGEVVDWCWIAPSEALATLPLVHATRRILESVVGEGDLSRLIRRLRRRRETPPVMPRIVRRPDGGIEIVD